MLGGSMACAANCRGARPCTSERGAARLALWRITVDAFERILGHLDLDELEALRGIGTGLRAVARVAALDGRVVRTLEFGLVFIQGRLVKRVQEAAFE